MDVDMRIKPRAPLRAAVVLIAASGIATASPARAAPLVLSYDDDDPEHLTTSGEIAVSGDVEVRFVAPHRAVNAVLHVWPAANEPCETTDPPTTGSQTYEVPLSVTTNEGTTTGTASVPHLQTSARFCFRVRWRHRRAMDEAVVRSAVDALLAAHDSFDQPMGLGETRALAVGLVDAVCAGHARAGDTCVPLDPVEVSELTFRLQSAYENTGIVEARADYAALLRLMDEANRTLERQAEEAGRLTERRLPPRTTMNRAWLEAITTVAAATEALEAMPSGQPYRQWRGLLERRKVTLQNRDQLIDNHTAAQSALHTLQNDTLPSAIRGTATTYLTGRIAYDSQAYATASGRTGDVGNYVSGDAGFALGVPLIDGQQNPWVLLYGGINIYFAPVERELPLGELVGSPGTIFAQIFSITVAYAGTLASTDLENADVDSYLGDGLPGLGFGFRVASFARISLISFLFRARSDSPLSDDERFGVALSIGASVDADVIALLTRAISGK